MAGADSTVRVNIVGDAKSLQKATGEAAKAATGMGKTFVKAGALIAGAVAVDALVDFGAEALNQADRVEDATGRIESQLGDLSQPLVDAAAGFTKLGLSKGDMLELEARIIDVGTALGIADENMGPLAEDAAATAAALELIGQGTTDTNIELIGKAAGGSEKALRALGITLDEGEVKTAALALAGKSAGDSLTEEELAAGRLHVILGELDPRIKEVTEGSGDFESKTKELDAKMENLQATIGEKLAPVLEGLLDFILRGIEGWELFAEWVVQNEDNLRELLTPLARVADGIGAIIGLVQELNKIDIPAWFSGIGPGGRSGPLPPSFPGGGGGNSGPSSVQLYVQGGSPEAIEQAVRNAVTTTARRG